MLKYQSKEYVNIVLPVQCISTVSGHENQDFILHKLNCISAISGHENQDFVNCFIASITCHINVTNYSDSKTNSLKVCWLAFFTIVI